jgi:hypothetical protein
MNSDLHKNYCGPDILLYSDLYFDRGHDQARTYCQTNIKIVDVLTHVAASVLGLNAIN